jgi:hypothetical protein
MGRKLEKIKKKILKYRPDKNSVNIGGNTLDWKIRKNKLNLKLSRKFQEEVTVTISCNVTGDLYRFKKPAGVKAEFKAEKRF